MVEAPNSAGNSSGNHREDRAGNPAGPPSGEAELATTIGANLRRLRTQQNLTLAGLSSLSAVSKSMLGEIELGHTTPNISLLWRIANALGTAVPAFLQTLSESEVLLFRGEGTLPAANFSSRELGPFGNSSRVKFHQVILAPGCKESSGTYPNGTTMNLVVGAGQLEIEVGAESYSLGTSDAAYFSAALPHIYRNPGQDCATAYVVTIYPVSVSFG
jgi:transcriptional regulator with XRE-family HTH domain